MMGKNKYYKQEVRQTECCSDICFWFHLLILKQHLQKPKSTSLMLMMRYVCARSNNAVCVDELPGYLNVSTGLVDEGKVEGDFPPQVDLIIRDTL